MYFTSINKAQGSYWENIGLEVMTVWTERSKNEGNILHVLYQASLVDKRFIIQSETTQKSSSQSDLAGSFGTVAGPVLREYWTDNGTI